MTSAWRILGVFLGAALCCLGLLAGCAANGPPPEAVSSAIPVAPPPPPAPPITDPADRVILENMVRNARLAAAATTREKCLKQECPEMFCWIELKELNISLTAYELTGRGEHLRDFVAGFENLRSILSRGEDGFLGWRGQPIEPLRDPAKPDVVIDEIQTSFRAVGVLSRFLELLRREPELRREFAALEKEYLDLMENHLVKKWESRGYYADLGDRGAVYRWNTAYTPTKANLTLAHEKQANLIEGLLGLYRVTGRDDYMIKAAKLGTWLKRCMSLVDGRYTWNYWDPVGPWDVHPQNPAKWKHWIGREPKGEWFSATVTSAMLLYHHGVVFDRTDVERFVKTQREVCWNGDLANPRYANTDGKAMAPNERFACPALAPFDEQLATLLFTGRYQAERLEKGDIVWHGGIVSGEWLRNKYVMLPAARLGQPLYGYCGEKFRQSAANRELLGRLTFEVVAPGWQAPLTPGQMKGLTPGVSP